MATINRICVDCGKNISKLQPQCMRCKNCQKKFVRKKSKTFLNRKKKERKLQFEPLGTTDFKAHRKKNFKKEAAEIKKEMQDLGLR